MSTLDSDFGFGAYMRKPSAAPKAARSAKPAFRQEARSDSAAERKQRGAVMAISIFAGLGFISVVIFATGYSALVSDTPQVWIHRLMALTLVQSILIAGIAMKLLPRIEPGKLSVRIFAGSGQRPALLDQPATSLDRSRPEPPPLPQPREPMIGGKLAGREYLAYEDGTIEINTLVGRRRFVSIEAAREFVGN